MGNELRSRTEELEKQGWVKQFTASEPRLSEAVDLYRESGFEVHLEPIPKAGEGDACPGVEKDTAKEECRICFQGFENQYKTIFTRRKKDFKTPGD